IALVYHPRPNLPPSSDRRVGALVMEARATVDRASFGKLTTDQTTITPVTVNGGPGYWIAGARHGFFFYTEADGHTDSFRLAGDVLIWNQAGLVIRIESGLDRRGAERVAGTVR